MTEGLNPLGAPEASRFRVVKGGSESRGLKVPVLLVCPNPGPTGGECTIAGGWSGRKRG